MWMFFAPEGVRTPYPTLTQSWLASTPLKNRSAAISHFLQIQFYAVSNLVVLFPMMNYFQVARVSILLPFLLLLISAMQMQADTVIDLRKGDDLKMLYDGGLRPWHVLGMERSNLDSGPDNMIVILPTGESFHLQVENASFTVVGGGKLVSCNLMGKQTSVEMAGAQTKAICNSLKLSTSGLDELMKNPGTMPDPEKAWGSRDVSHDPMTVQVVFRPLVGFQNVTAIVNVYLGWKRPMSENVIISPEPIKPPPGYEGVSMDRPPRDPNIKPFPEHDSKYYETMLRQALAKGNIPAAPVTSEPVVGAKTTPTPNPAEAPIPTAETERQTRIWPWVAGILAAVIVIGFLLKRRT